MPASRFFAAAAAAALAAPLLLTSCIFPSPSPGTHAELSAVATISATNAFAVGDFTDKTGQHELMERWNGKSWQTVFLPPPIGKSLTSITAVNGHNVWAVSELRTLHFGGLGWRSFPNPAGISMYGVESAADSAVYGLGRGSNNADSLWLMTAGGWRLMSAIPKLSSSECNASGRASDLAVVKARDVYVVGSGTKPQSTQSCTVALHWDGTTWQLMTTPGVAGRSLSAVSARSDSDVWAVGQSDTYDPQLGISFQFSLVLHWNGTTWSQVLPGTVKGFLRDVVATPHGVWAVGMQQVGAGFPLGMVIQKWNGTSMANQVVQNPTPPKELNVSVLEGVSERDGVVTSVGNYAPRAGVTATLTDRRNAS
jgi:hypothetical protein